MQMLLVEIDKDLRVLLHHVIPRNPFSLVPPLQQEDGVATVAGHLQHAALPILLHHPSSLFGETTPNRNVLIETSLIRNSLLSHLPQ